MFPKLAKDHVIDNGLGDTVLFPKAFLGNSTKRILRANVFYFLLSQFGVAIALAFCCCAMYNTIFNVDFVSSPLKIGNVVIGPSSVGEMTSFATKRAWANKSLQNESVDVQILKFWQKPDGKIAAFALSSWFQLSPRIGKFAMPIPLAPNVAIGRNTVAEMVFDWLGQHDFIVEGSRS